MSNPNFAYSNEDTITEVSRVANEFEIKDLAGRRKTIRFEGNLTAVLSTGRQSFRTKTVNVSTGGVLLSELLPPSFVSQDFEILLIAERAGRSPLYIMARGIALEAPLRSSRIKLTKAPAEMQKTLQGLFN